MTLRNYFLFLFIISLCNACSVNQAKNANSYDATPYKINLIKEQTLPAPRKLSKQEQEAYLSKASREITNTPTKYLRVKHYQDPQGPLLVSIKNNSPLIINKLTLVSQLFNVEGNIINQESWSTTHSIPPNTRSRYYPTPVSYHLNQNERIKTIIKKVLIKQP